MDDILIYSKNLEEHEKHVEQVLEKLQEAGLHINADKCEFHTTSTTFVGFVLSPDGISMDPEKVKTVQEWEVPRTLKELQSFLGFANFYRRFIKGYTRIARPLNKLSGKNKPFVWTSVQQKAFDALKKAFCSFPILRHFDSTRETVLETDA